MDDLHRDDPRQPDMDLQSALTNNGGQGYAEEDIATIHACVAGEADGPDWFWILQLHDGRVVLAVGGCDYTGWDCQSDLSSHFFDSPMEAARNADQYRATWDERKITVTLRGQLNGEIPYGLYTEKHSERGSFDPVLLIPIFVVLLMIFGVTMAIKADMARTKLETALIKSKYTTACDKSFNGYHQWIRYGSYIENRFYCNNCSLTGQIVFDTIRK